MKRKPKTADRLYYVGTTLSLRRAGVKGKTATVEIGADEDRVITLRGETRGTLSFAMSDILWLRAGIEFGRVHQNRCVIARADGHDVVFDSSWAAGYSELIVRIAAELDAIGRFERVQRGLRWWENLIHLAIFGGLCLVLLYAPYDTWRTHGADWGRQNLLIAGVLAATALFGLFYVLAIWWRWYRPRRVRDVTDLEEVLG